MSNLLLERDKKTMRRDYFLRLTSISLFLFSAAALIGSALLLPSLFLVESKKKTLSSQAELEQVTPSQDEDLRTAVKSAGEKLALLVQWREREQVGELLTGLLEERPAGIRLTSITYTHRDAGGSTFAVNGVAESRTSLIDFSKQLERNQQFTEVVLPVSNLAGNRNIIFSLTMKSVQ